MTVKNLELHLEALARENHIVIQWRKRPWSKFEAHIPTRAVYIGPPTSVLRYFAALHEIGHIASTDSLQFHESDQLLICEAAAWAWAFEHALAEMVPKAAVPKVREKIADAWATYLPKR